MEGGCKVGKSGGNLESSLEKYMRRCKLKTWGYPNTCH